MTTLKLNKEIIEMVKGIQSITQRAIIEYKRELNEIIDSNCREKRRIERTLDGMLDFCFDKNMVELFRRLCRYYYAIDQKTTAEYVLFYRDMWDSEAKVANSRPLKNKEGNSSGNLIQRHPQRNKHQPTQEVAYVKSK